MTARAVGRRLETIIQYEPSWFAEFMCATGIFWWGGFTFLSDDYNMEGIAVLAPAIALIAGPLRIYLLFRLNSFPRVVAAMLGLFFWSQLAVGLFTRSGFLNSHGMLLSLAVGELLTICKFSLTSIRSR